MIGEQGELLLQVDLFHAARLARQGHQRNGSVLLRWRHAPITGDRARAVTES
jgi:hypothetical protein